ncbi:hypothetical protein FK498_00220 [Elioraea sp. Yellowstone]|jgi:uncharacterized protein|uniref:Mth938-like domain-containing protein n=1 Tax=Elioraea sp. Yellowstone TaxID=2592070 RepID=UPI00114DA437|nr:Mth938-like domain-containing protein [Elioraea sp. Yellowstone]TQF85675.1 hypothetical protein FK498_00220 [Elioraea sp. Yellowstone]
MALPALQGYGPDGFRIAGEIVAGSVILLPDRVLPWTASCLAEATPESLAPVIEASAALDLLVLGTGRRFALVPPGLAKALRAVGIAVEAMDTTAACRTFPTLAAEGRRVAAALIAL